MATGTVQTTLGPVAPEQLGRTLMHEHLVIGYPGFESDTIRPGPSRDERIAQRGSYPGFDRFGLDMLQPDAKRIESLLRLIRAGRGTQVVVSDDSVWCWRGEPIGRPEAFAAVAKT